MGSVGLAKVPVLRSSRTQNRCSAGETNSGSFSIRRTFGGPHAWPVRTRRLKDLKQANPREPIVEL